MLIFFLDGVKPIGCELAPQVVWFAFAPSLAMLRTFHGLRGRLNVFSGVSIIRVSVVPWGPEEQHP